MTDAPHDPRRSGDPEEFGSGPHYPSAHGSAPHGPSPYEAAPPGYPGQDHGHRPRIDSRDEPHYPVPHDPQVPAGGAPAYSHGYSHGHSSGYGSSPGRPTWGAAPGVGPGYAPAPPSAGLGITAMIFGIIALLLGFIPIVGLISLLLGPLAVILGIIAMVRRNGRGFGLAGVITGGLGVAVTIAVHIISGLALTAFVEEVDRYQEELQQQPQQDEAPAEDDGEWPSGLLPQDMLEEIEELEQRLEDADAEEIREVLERWGEEIDQHELDRLQQELEQRLGG